MYENKTLYKDYSATGSSQKDIIARMVQRAGWRDKYKENGSCRQLMIDSNILEVEDE